MKKIILLSIILLTFNSAKAQDWLLDYEIEMDVKLKYIQYGDMSVYIGFDLDNGKEISFAYWNWAAEAGSIKSNIEDFDETDYGKSYKIKVKYSTINELEYRFDEGNVETGEMVNEWVLIKIINID
jgi:hypothetical protein